MKYYTKRIKNKNYKKYSKKRYYKNVYDLYGGYSNTNLNNNLNINHNIEKINQQVQNENSLKNLLPSIQMPSTSLADSEIIKKSVDLAEGVGVKALEGIGNTVGIDITNPNQVNEKLRQIKETITDPRNIEQMKDIASNVAEIGAVGIEAAKPFLDPLIETTVDKFKTAASEIGEAGVKIALNTAEEIPGVGIVVGTIRNLSNAGEAGLAAVNAGSEVIKTASDSINAATKNFNRLIKEKGDLIKRTQDSVDRFMNPLKYNPKNYLDKYNPQNYLNKYNPPISSYENNETRGGRKYRKYNNKKTKRNK